MQAAFDAANGGTVKTLQRFVKGTVTIAQNVTLDLSGVEVTSFNYEEFHIMGSVTVLADGSGTIEGSNTLDVPVTVKSGGKLIVPAEYSAGVENRVCLNKNVTVETGGSVQLDGGTCRYIEAMSGSVTVNGGSVERTLILEKGSEAEINGGSIGILSLSGIPNSVTISGGSFENIYIYKADYRNNPIRTEVTYDDFAALLTDGKAFKLTNGEHWANNSDLKSSGSWIEYIILGNVTVVDVPIKNLTIDGANSVQYGTTTVLTANADAGENQLTYQWYQVTDSRKTPIDGAVSSTYTVPTSTLGSNTYAVEADCNGYRVCSEPFEVTVAPRELKLPIIEAGTDTKEYDGTTDTALKITGFYADTARKEPVTLTEGVDFTLDSAAYENPSVGEKGNNGPLIIRDSNGPDMVLFSWEQYWKRYGSLHEKDEKERIEKLCREYTE